MASIYSLPNEILSHIEDYLPFKSIIYLMMTCNKLYHSISSDNVAWRSLYIKKYYFHPHSSPHVTKLLFSSNVKDDFMQRAKVKPKVYRMKCEGEECQASLISSRLHVLAYANENHLFGAAVNSSPCEETLFNIPWLNCNIHLDLHFKSKIEGVACGLFHCIAWTTEGQMWDWECRFGLQLKKGRWLIAKSRIVKGACGSHSSFALTENGNVYSWGQSLMGEMGVGYYKRILNPFPINFPQEERIIDLDCSGKACGAVSKSGNIYWWGFSNIPTRRHTRYPEMIASVSSPFSPVSLSCGPGYVSSIDEQGKLYFFPIIGNNYSVQDPPSGDPFVKVIASDSSLFALTASGKLRRYVGAKEQEVNTHEKIIDIGKSGGGLLLITLPSSRPKSCIII